jgi:hypothetical protein
MVFSHDLSPSDVLFEVAKQIHIQAESSAYGKGEFDFTTNFYILMQ